MKTFLLDIIPKIKRYSERLDNRALLTNKHWVVIDKDLTKKVVFIFREKENQLLVSQNGTIEKGSWDYLGNESLLIETSGGAYLFKHGFIDNTVLALKVDGKEEYALLVNDDHFNINLNSVDGIIQFLSEKYSLENRYRKLTIPKVNHSQRLSSFSQNMIEPTESFNPKDYISFEKDIEKIKEVVFSSNEEFAAEILISFCRDHSIKAEHKTRNPYLSKMIVNNKLPITLIEQLFRINKDNKTFINELELFITQQLKND